MKQKTRVVYRCAITGRWVSKAYAEANPTTTVAHTIKAKETPDA